MYVLASGLMDKAMLWNVIVPVGAVALLVAVLVWASRVRRKDRMIKHHHGHTHHM